MALLRIITRNARRIETLLTDFLHADKPVSKNQQTDICAILDQALERVSYQIGLSGCLVKKQYRTGLIMAGNREHLVAAFESILRLSLDSMEYEKGELLVAVFQHPEKLTVIIKDNGRGWDARTVKHLFDGAASPHAHCPTLLSSKTALIAFNANIEISSKPRCGTTYAINFYKKLFVN